MYEVLSGPVQGAEVFLLICSSYRIENKFLSHIRH